MKQTNNNEDLQKLEFYNSFLRRSWNKEEMRASRIKIHRKRVALMRKLESQDIIFDVHRDGFVEIKNSRKKHAIK
jgi:hypothetical protein